MTYEEFTKELWELVCKGLDSPNPLSVSRVRAALYEIELNVEFFAREQNIEDKLKKLKEET